MAVTITLPDNIKMALPGDRLTVKCKLDRPLPIGIGTHFAFREGNQTVAGGVITTMFPDPPEDVNEDNLRDQAKKKKKAPKAKTTTPT